MDNKRIWRKDITGLRALAVLPVIVFHAFPDVLPGGFYGVDVFFCYIRISYFWNYL